MTCSCHQCNRGNAIRQFTHSAKKMKLSDTCRKALRVLKFLTHHSEFSWQAFEQNSGCSSWSNEDKNEFIMHLVVRHRPTVKLVELRQQLVKLGADQYITDGLGCNWVHNAILHHHYEWLNFLKLDSKLLDARANGGFTPVMLAALHFNENVVRLLLHAGADVTVLNDEGRSLVDCVQMRFGDHSNIFHFVVELHRVQARKLMVEKFNHKN